jgi:predicted Zn-dependent protease
MLALATPVAAGTAPPAPLPPYAGAYQPQTVDERGAWMTADEVERAVRDSQFVIGDAALQGYVRRVLCRTVGEDRCRGVRIYVVRVPAFNANMMANGTLQIWTGALLRMRNEAELAAILGHEFAHFEQRHIIRGFRQQRSATDAMAWMGVAGAFGGGSTVALQVSILGSIFTYGRAQETEADLLSARYMARSGYDLRCFADIWERLMGEADATALGRRQRSHRYDRVAFFASHPTELDRATYLKAEAAKLPPGGETDEAAWAAAMKPWRAGFLADQLKLNDFGGTEYLLGELARGGWTEDLLFARGELYRARGNPRDLVAAADFYRQAIALDPAHAESHRGLGLALMRAQAVEEGRAALRRYLELSPQAGDAPMISMMLS